VIPFPKRPRAKSIDLEDEDILDCADASRADVDDLVDTTERPPQASSAPPPAAASGAYGNFPPLPPPNPPPAATSLAPVAMSTRARQLTYKIPRGAPPPNDPWYMIGRPSMPWAAALIAFGAIGATLAHAALDAIASPPATVAAASAPPPPPVVALPLSPPAPTKPAPVVLKFTNDQAVTVALPPAPPPPAPAPPPPPQTAARAPAPAVAAAPPPKKVAAAPPPSAPPSAAAVKNAQSIDSLADAQLKAALK
jgi:hypothetical protein